MHSTVQPGRLLYLDSLRGLAALMVAAGHFIEWTPFYGSLPFQYLNLGKIGVIAFFLLSGMVIPFSFKQGPGANCQFWISRFFRLYPVYWLSILLALLSARLIDGALPDLRSILANLTMFQALLGAPDLFGVYWTLLIEMFFYITCSLLFCFRLLEKASIRFLMALLLLCAALLFALARFYLAKKIPVALPLGMSLMFFGSIWREISLGTATSTLKKMCAAYLWSFFLLLIPICLFAYNRDYGHGETAMVYMGSYATGIVLSLVLSTWVKLEHRALVFLGGISYSLYLVHPFALKIYASRIDTQTFFDASGFVIYLTCALACATISSLLIEKHCIRLGRMLKGKYVLPLPPQSPPESIKSAPNQPESSKIADLINTRP